MNLEEKIGKLSAQERKILKVLEKFDSEAYVREIEESADLSHSGIMRSALNLEENEFLEIKEETREEISITEEGRDYLENSLPEKRLIEFLSKEGPSPIDVVSENLDIPQDKIGICIGWGKRKGWINIQEEDSGKVLSITDAGKEALDGEEREKIFLKKFEENDTLYSNELPSDLRKETSTLESRELIEREERTRHKLALSEMGEEALEFDFDVREKVSRLTSELLKSGGWKDVELREYNVTAPGPEIYPGKEHPQRRIIEELRSILLRMGFKEIRGPIVESEFWNFDALFQAQNHPAREIHDTLSLSKPERAEIPDEGLLERVKEAHEEGVAGSKGWGYEFDKEISHKTILRSQTTADTVRYLAQQPEPPVKVFCIDKVFRRERIDYQHLAEFPQAEGIVMAPDLNFRHMLGYLKQILVQMGIPKIRFRPGYFPYTEPSAEADGYFPERDEWIELLGAGMFRPELLEPLGIEYPVLAWGIGFSRIAMIRMGIEDMRDLHKNDLKWLNEQTLG